MRAEGHHARRKGFTLLELIVAFTILALFVLPILEILAASRVRAVKYTRERVVRDLAQRKLFDRVYSIEISNEGTFDVEGHPEWRWEVPYPEVVSQGSQVLLQYTIRVSTPDAENRGATTDLGESRPSFEMSVWTFPSQGWFEEQEELQALGYDTGASGMGLPPGGNLGR